VNTHNPAATATIIAANVVTCWIEIFICVVISLVKL